MSRIIMTEKLLLQRKWNLSPESVILTWPSKFLQSVLSHWINAIVLCGFFIWEFEHHVHDKTIKSKQIHCITDKQQHMTTTELHVHDLGQTHTSCDQDQKRDG